MLVFDVPFEVWHGECSDRQEVKMVAFGALRRFACDSAKFSCSMSSTMRSNLASRPATRAIRAAADRVLIGDESLNL